MVWQAKYKKWKTNSAPAVAPTSTDGSPPRSAALSHKYKSDFTEILKNGVAEIQNIKKQNCQQTAQHATARTLLGIKEITTFGRSWEIFLKSWVNLRYGQDAVVESGLTMKNDRKLFFKRKKRWVRSVFTISHEGYDAQKWVPWRVLRSSFLALNRSIDTNTRKDWILWQVLYFSDELGDTSPLL